MLVLAVTLLTPYGSQGTHGHRTPVKHGVGRNVSTRRGSGHKTEVTSPKQSKNINTKPRVHMVPNSPVLSSC